MKTYKNVCELFCKSRRGRHMSCCHFCPYKDNCPSFWGKCLNSPDKCGYYAKEKKISGDFLYCKSVNCKIPDEKKESENDTEI
jgi:hypothetical protein